MAAAVTCSNLEPQPTLDFAPECTSGWAWIGMSLTRQALCLCPCAVTSVLESRSSLGCIADRRSNESKRTRATATGWQHFRASVASTNQAYRDARRRHDMKLLSIRCETAPT